MNVRANLHKVVEHYSHFEMATHTIYITIPLEVYENKWADNKDDSITLDFDGDEVTIEFHNIDSIDIEDLTEDTMCEWLGFDYEDVLRTNYEDFA